MDRSLFTDRSRWLVAGATGLSAALSLGLLAAMGLRPISLLLVSVPYLALAVSRPATRRRTTAILMGLIGTGAASFAAREHSSASNGVMTVFALGAFCLVAGFAFTAASPRDEVERAG